MPGRTTNGVPYALLTDAANAEIATRELATFLDPLVVADPNRDEVATVRRLGRGTGEALSGRDVAVANERIPTNESVSVAKTGRERLGLANGAFRAFRSTAQSIARPGATVVFDEETFDVGGWYNVATGRFTPLVAGIYRISAFVYVKPVTSVLFETYIQKNGVNYATVCRDLSAGSANRQMVSGATTLVSLNGSTDYVSVFAGSSETANVNTAVNEECYFEGELVGKI